MSHLYISVSPLIISMAGCKVYRLCIHTLQIKQLSVCCLDMRFGCCFKIQPLLFYLCKVLCSEFTELIVSF